MRIRTDDPNQMKDRFCYFSSGFKSHSGKTRYVKCRFLEGLQCGITNCDLHSHCSPIEDTSLVELYIDRPDTCPIKHTAYIPINMGGK